jgi:long-chain acyl-CoA synthetase
VRTHLASLVEDFRHHAAETAVVTHRGNRRYRTTYGELAQLAGRFAAELDLRGIPAGERVVLWGANSAEWISAFFGCLLRGVIAVPLDAAGSPEFAARVVKDVAPKLIVGDPNLVHHLTGIEEIPHLWLSELPAQLPAEPNFTISKAVTPQTPFQIVFTSGTTSEPKGIVHTHANVLSSVRPIEHEMKKYHKYERWVHPLRFLHTLPLSHVFGQFMGLWLPPLLAGEIHFAEQLEARRMTDLIRRERISVLVAVPRILQLLRVHLLGRFDDLAAQVEHIEKPSILKQWWQFRRVHSILGWKFWAVISGGAAMPADLEQFWNRIGIALIQGYGMTETTALVTLNHPFKIAQGTIGKTLPGREVRLSEDGEILVRGDMLATATWQGGAMRQREGEWLATGDLGQKNEHGELEFLGRKGDVIVTSGGMNVHPEDLETAMKKQPGVRDCVVVPCQLLGGIEPVAVAISSGDEAQLQQAVLNANRELADFQQIRRMFKWPEPQFPYTTTGKLLRRKVSSWVCQQIQDQQQPAKHSGPHSSITGSDIVLDLIAEVTGEHSPDASNEMRLTEDLHLDSLGRVQLQTALEQRLDLELSDDVLASVETLGDLRAMIGEQIAPGSPGQSDSSRPSIQTIPNASLDSTGSHTAEPGQSTRAPENPPPSIPSTETETAPKRSVSPVDDAPRALTSEHLYPRWPWSWPFQSMRAAFLELVMRPLVWLLGAPRVVSQIGELPPGPLLIIANHVSAYDGALVLYALPGKLRRHTAIAMLGEMLLDYRLGRNQPNLLLNLLAPPQYWLVTALFNVFPLPRLHGFRRSFAHAGEAMDRGYSVMVFPEGARNKDGNLRPFRQGIGLLAQESRIPILPVALVGLDEIARREETRKTAWFRSGQIEIRLGEVIPVDEELEPAELTVKLETAIRQLLT